MQPTLQSLVADALLTIEHLQRFAEEALGPTTALRPTDLLKLPDLDATRAVQDELLEQISQPITSALNLCMASAHSLIGVAQVLSEADDISPSERARTWKALDLTKVAGRSAYRATLVLAEGSLAVGLEQASTPI